jgi:hypothetical protein
MVVIVITATTRVWPLDALRGNPHALKTFPPAHTTCQANVNHVMGSKRKPHGGYNIKPTCVGWQSTAMLIFDKQHMRRL